MVAMECEARAAMQSDVMDGFRLQLDQVMGAQEAELNPRFVVNVVSGMLHCVGRYQLGGLSSEWKASCGWAFGRGGAYVFVHGPTDARVGKICRCAQAAVAAYRAQAA